MTRALLLVVVVLAVPALAGPPAPARLPVVVPTTPWVTTSCWIEPRWFETLRDGPLDYCKRSLRYRPGKLDCLSIEDEVCWTLNTVTGEWSQLRNARQERPVICPEGPEGPTCPRLRLH